MASRIPVFGLDLCSPTVRLALADRHRSYVRVRRLLDLPLEQSGIETGTIESAALGVSLKNAIQPHLRHLPRAAVLAIPDTQTYAFTVRLGRDAQSDPAEAIRWEASQHMPFALDELSLDWQKLRTDDEGDRIQIAAAPRELIATYCEAMDRAGITTVAVVPASVASLNTFERIDHPSLRVIVLLERSLTTIMGLAGQELLLTLMSECCTGARVHEILKKELSLDDTEAQQTLRLCGVDPTVSRGIVRKALGSELERLRTVIVRMREYLELERHADCRSVLIAGELAQLKALDQELSHLTGMDVSVAPLSFTPQFHPPKNSVLTPAASIVALGAALYPQT